jgi:tetratricopeptide (TPR) repeat protein
MPTSAYNQLGLFDKALEDLTQAIDLDPDYADALNSRAYQLARQNGDLDQALEDALKAVELAPDQMPKLDTLGYVYYKLGEYDQAMEIFNQALDAGHDFSHFGRGLVYEALGEPDKALEEYYTFLKIEELALGIYNDEVEEARQHIEALGGTLPE